MYLFRSYFRIEDTGFFRYFIACAFSDLTLEFIYEIITLFFNEEFTLFVL